MENFKDCPIYSNQYLIGDKGTVISKRSSKEMKFRLTYDGYYDVGLSKNGKKKTIRVHRLVALTHLPKIPGKDIINHKDGNKLNNDVNNLEWCTVQENTVHSYQNGLQIAVNGSQHGRSKYKEKDIHHVCKLLQQGTPIKQIHLATGIPIRTIQSIRVRDNWTHISVGYVFKDRRFKSNV